MRCSTGRPPVPSRDSRIHVVRAAFRQVLRHADKGTALAEAGDVAALPGRFHSLCRVVLANVGDRLAAWQAVQDREAGQCRTGPPVSAAAGDLDAFGLGSRHASRSASAAAARSDGSQKSGQRSHRASQGTRGGCRPSRYRAKAGSGPAGSGRWSPRPRTSLPEGSRSTPAVAGSQAAIMQVSVAFAAGMASVLAPGHWPRPRSAALPLTALARGGPAHGRPARDHRDTSWDTDTQCAAAISQTRNPAVKDR